MPLLLVSATRSGSASRCPPAGYAITLILGLSLVADAAVELVLDAAAGLLAADGGCSPMSCSRALNALPNRLCADPTGTWAAVLLVLVESAERSSSEPFL